jgi:hypothetical protein
MQQDGGVLCPICQRAHLVQLHGVIACPVDRFQLDVRAEGITLDNVRQRLAGTYEVSMAAGALPSRSCAPALGWGGKHADT